MGNQLRYHTKHEKKFLSGLSRNHVHIIHMDIQDVNLSPARAHLRVSGSHLKASGGIRAGARGHLGAIIEGNICKNSNVFFRKWHGRPFRVNGSTATLAISTTCTQKLASDRGKIPMSTLIWISFLSRQSPFSVHTIWKDV